MISSNQLLERIPPSVGHFIITRLLIIFIGTGEHMVTLITASALIQR
jgi:hypothetical protein